MAIEVFNRYENKYMIDEKMFVRLQSRLSDYMEPDDYNKHGEAYTIANIYYDTQDNHLIRTSLAKPRYKEKLRIRAYGVPESDSKVYIEIKKKVAGLVNKRRSAMKLDEAYSFLEAGNLPELNPKMNTQVLREIGYILEQHELKPALYLAYDRRAYFGNGNHDLRISFDANIRTRRDDLRLESGMYGQQLLEKDTWLMEVKVGQSMPVWLTRLLSENKIYPTSFSKYGTEYMRTLKETAKPKIFVFEPLQQPFTAKTPISVAV